MAQCSYKITDSFDGRELVSSSELYRLNRRAIYRKAQSVANEINDEVALINVTRNTLAKLVKPKGAD